MKRTKKTKKRRPRRTKNEQSTRSSCWVDRIAFGNRIDGDADADDTSSTASSSLKISLVSWNVLAHSYCSRKSQHHLPLDYQKIVFSPAKRKAAIVNILLRRLVATSNPTTATGDTNDDDDDEDDKEEAAAGAADIVCLQEVDMEEIGAALKKVGWKGVETPRLKAGGGAGTKVDSCIVYVNPQKWKIVEHKVVTLDDLATLSTRNINSSSSADIPSPTCSNLQGLQQSFLRRNVGLLVRLENVPAQDDALLGRRTFCLVNTHLFWNPTYDYVKFCQMHYLLQQAHAFCLPDEPLVLAGDLNSTPSSSVYKYLSRGHLDARLVAPWNRKSDNEPCDGNDKDAFDAEQGMANLQISVTSSDDKQDPPTIKYLLDFTLNKLCRWLRILGQDVALESTEEERQRTKENNMILFKRCREEGRTLMTTSKSLVERNDCPPGSYLIKTVTDLEVTLVHILLTHGVSLDPTTFLTRCVVCNGLIRVIHQVDHKERILQSYNAPTDSADALEVYECTGCQQGYWWSDRPNSSASRIKDTTTRLFELCLQAGVPLRDENNLGFFDYVDVQEQRSKGWDFDIKGSELLRQNLDFLEWLKMPKIESPFEALRSAYAHEVKDGASVQGTGECIPFTNVTDDFVDTLDYVFYDSSNLCLEDRLWVPVSFKVLNEKELPNGHVLPSDIFPSDHLPIGARLSFKDAPRMHVASVTDTTADPNAAEASVATNESSTKLPQKPDEAADVMSIMTFAQPPHKTRCDCGCVPPTPSLFEMAELRKQARAKLKNQSTSS